MKCKLRIWPKIYQPSGLKIIFNKESNPSQSLIYFAKKSKFWLKIETLVKNRNFGQIINFGNKSKFWPKIEIFLKNILVKYPDFSEKYKFWSNIQIFLKNINFGQISRFFLKNINFGQKYKFWSKI